MRDDLSDFLLSELCRVIEAGMGLHYTPDRRPHVARAVKRAASGLGFDSPTAFAEWLLEEPHARSRVECLVGHLTIGETHFFRDENLFRFLEERFLPELVSGRRLGSRHVRIWSAACATGEEPYSLAVVLKKLIPNEAGWRLTILGTDINVEFLDRAEKAIYTHWSFRSVPTGFKESFFRKSEEGYQLIPEIRRMVKLARLNLADDVFSVPAEDTADMDVIFCRNVLMYFSSHRQERVIDNLCRNLTDGGLFVVSPAEASLVRHDNLVVEHHPGAIVFRKTAEKSVKPKPFEFPAGVPVFQFQPDVGQDLGPPFTMPLVPAIPDVVLPPLPAPVIETPAALAADVSDDDGRVLFQKGLYKEAEARLRTELEEAERSGEDVRPVLAMLVKTLANQGRLDQALECSDSAIAVDKVNPRSHYLHGTILHELGRIPEAVAAIKRAIFLEPDHVAAHFALGNLERQRGKPKDSGRYYRTALSILAGLKDEEVVPDTEGMTAGKLTEIILTMTRKESAHDKP
ncbi:MAG: CheR family methyltransferase [Pseudomonadota bacterium]